VKYAVVPQVYTIIAFGASLFLMPFLTKVVIGSGMEAMPYYLIHPLFTLEFCLWLSTAIAWFIAFAFSLRNIRKQALTLTEIVGQNLPIVFLAAITVIIALSGCVGFSGSVHFPRSGIPTPDLFSFLRGINYLGILVCEPAWIIAVLWKYLSAR